MSRRIRLTRRAADDERPYAGSINQPGRVEEEIKSDSYDKDDYEVPGWELQDKPTKFKDERNDIGFPEKTEKPAESRKASEQRKAHVAQIRQAANKAVKLAVLLLGDKVPEKMIEGQAHEFMRMGDAGLTRALKRYALTEKMYAEEEVEAPAEAKKSEEAPVEEELAPAEAKKSTDDNDADDVVEAPAEARNRQAAEMLMKLAEKLLADEEVEAPAEAKKAETSEIPSVDGKKAEEEVEAPAEAKKAEEPAKEEAPAEDKKAGDVPAGLKKWQEANGVGKKEEGKKAEAPAEGEEVAKKSAKATVAKSKKADDAELDIEMTSTEGDAEMSEGDETALAGLYAEEEVPVVEEAAAPIEDEVMGADEEIAPVVEEAPVAMKKAGVQKLGGQPKVASSTGDLDLNTLWSSAPDVSSVFK